MLRARPLTDSFSLPWRWDPALDSERFETPEEYQTAYATACETLDFSSITKPGDTPSLFVFRPLKGSQMRCLLEESSGQIGPSVCALAFRLTLVRVDNFEMPDGLKLDRATAADHPELGPMIKPAVVDYFDALAVAAGRDFGSIVTELGGRVMERCLVPSGK